MVTNVYCGHEKSIVSHVALVDVSRVFPTFTTLAVSASVDGQVNFWRRIEASELDLLRSFAFSPPNPLTCLCTLSHGHQALLATGDLGGTVRIFDLTQLELVRTVHLPEQLSQQLRAEDSGEQLDLTAECMQMEEGEDLSLRLCIALRDIPVVAVYDLLNGEEPPLLIHTQCPVLRLAPVHGKLFGFLVDFAYTYIDMSGHAMELKELPFPEEHPEAQVISVASNDTYLAILDDAHVLHVFKHLPSSLKLYRQFRLAEESEIVGESEHDFRDSAYLSFNSVLFVAPDELLVSTPTGIWRLDIKRKTKAKVVDGSSGKQSVRFVHLAYTALALIPRTTSDLADYLLYTAPTEDGQGSSNESPAVLDQGVDEERRKEMRLECPTLVATRFRSPGLWVFDPSSLPISDLDSAPTHVIDIPRAFAGGALSNGSEQREEGWRSHRYVMLRTTLGDIALELYAKAAPKAVENFVKLIQRRYYDNCPFHRIIPDFIVQAGDPTGAGTGGRSIWRRDFENETTPALTFSEAGRLAMANTGRPSSNGSQFFVTLGKCPWLNGKYTIFGQCLKGLDVCQAISQRPTVPFKDRPKEPARILTVDLLTEPSWK
jgi:cyclophilin family peptidyl-prolyl cis-trans isomerase